MARTNEQLKSMRKKSREKLLEAAITVFTKRGYAATSMQDIATEADVSVGLIYRHFTNKEALFGVLVQQALEGLRALDALFSVDQDPATTFEMMTGEILTDLRSPNGQFAQFMMLIGQSFVIEDLVPQTKQLIKQNQKTSSLIAQVIKKGQEQGVFKEGSADAMAQYYLASIRGLAEMQFALGKKFIAPTIEMMHAFLFKEDVYDR